MKVLVRLIVFSALLCGALWALRETPLFGAPPANEPVAVATPAAPKTDVQASGPTGDPSTGVWTSRDGRTMRATYQSSTETTVTVRREDGQVFTFPLANLTPADAAWVARQPRPRVITQKQLDDIVARFPAAPGLGGEVTNELRQLHDKYRSMVKFIRPGTIEANLKMIRSKIADDVKTLSHIAGTRSGDWTGKRGSSQSAAAEETILSARRSVSWLEGPLTHHVNAYEALLNARE